MSKIISWPRKLHRSVREQGFGLIEIMISLFISLFLLAGLSTIFIGTRQTFIAQGGLAQMQNNQIMARNIIGNVVQSAGYFSSPLINTTNTALPAQIVAHPMAGNINFFVGQVLSGVRVNAADSIAVRSLGAMDCTGNTDTNNPVVSIFTVSNNNLLCSVNGQTSQSLVSGVASMTLLYGVDPAGSGSATQYMTAANVPAWSSVRSVMVTLNFVNPLGQPATIPFTVVFGVMAQL
jgi:type IV pilus assembly protein PilW